MSVEIVPIYRVRPENPEAHLFAVALEIPPVPVGEIRVSMPAWIPGSYMIRDFARNIVAISAEDAAGPVALVKEDKQTWSLASTGTAVTLRYLVYAWELSVRTAHLDRTHAYFNGPCLFLRVQGLDQAPCRLELAPPDGDAYRDWRVATSLERRDAEPWGFGSYAADDYQDLIDHPVEMGVFDLIEFRVCDVPHHMALTGRHRADGARLAADLARICATHAALFGELPVDRYLFLTTVVGEGYGGLEHRFSSSLLCGRDQLPRASAPGGSETGTGSGSDRAPNGAIAPDPAPEPAPEPEPPNPEYRRFLGLCSHEYLHLWHVKRIRPAVFMDGRLDREVHTRLLWAFEGITSYYDDLALVRSGCIDAQAYLDLLAQTITRVTRNPGRLRQTLAESSFDAWTRFYQQDANTPNAVVSYYAKGALVALALDLTIRRDSADTRSLDDLMRALWERHGKPGIGVPEQGVEALAAEVTGLDLADFFAQALDSTGDLDLGGLLATMGVGLRMRPARGPTDMGGTGGQDQNRAGPADRAAPRTSEKFEQGPAKPDLGIRLAPDVTEPVIGVVLSDRPAERAGLAPGDSLVALDGIRIRRENLDALVAAVPAGARAEVHAFRRDELMRFDVLSQPAPSDTCELCLMSDQPQAIADRRARWLGSAE